MADAALVAADPPAWLRRAFEGCARGLRRSGRLRYVVADVAGAIAYGVQPPAKRRLCAHLHARAAGGLPAREARRRARASYRNYARMIVDTIWVHAIPLDEMLEHGHIHGVERLHATRDTGSGGIIALVHHGSWDIAASMALAAGHAVTTVMAPVGPPEVTALLAWSRRAKRMELYTAASAARGLIRAVRQGRLVAILVDIPEGGPTTPVRWCRGPVLFSTGPATLARITGAPVIPVGCWRTARGYHVDIHAPLEIDPVDDDESLMQRIADVLEADVRRVPEQWYPFNPIYTDEP